MSTEQTTDNPGGDSLKLAGERLTPTSTPDVCPDAPYDGFPHAWGWEFPSDDDSESFQVCLYCGAKP